jgi:hypothetical protein
LTLITPNHHRIDACITREVLVDQKTLNSGVQRQVRKITIKAAIYTHLSSESVKYVYLCKIVSIGKNTTSAAIRPMRADVKSMF